MSREPSRGKFGARSWIRSLAPVMTDGKAAGARARDDGKTDTVTRPGAGDERPRRERPNN